MIIITYFLFSVSVPLILSFPLKNFMKDIIQKDEFHNEYEKKRFKIMMKGMDSERFNPHDLAYFFYNMGFIIAFVLFEAFNNELIYILEEVPKNGKYRGISIHNIKKLENKINELLIIDIKKKFRLWGYIEYYHLSRNNLVHRDGIVDSIFCKIIKQIKLDVDLPECDIEDRVLIDKKIFEGTIDLMLFYLDFINKEIN